MKELRSCSDWSYRKGLAYSRNKNKIKNKINLSEWMCEGVQRSNVIADDYKFILEIIIK